MHSKLKSLIEPFFGEPEAFLQHSAYQLVREKEENDRAQYFENSSKRPFI